MEEIQSIYKQYRLMLLQAIDRNGATNDVWRPVSWARDAGVIRRVASHRSGLLDFEGTPPTVRAGGMFGHAGLPTNGHACSARKSAWSQSVSLSLNCSTA